MPALFCLVLSLYFAFSALSKPAYSRSGSLFLPYQMSLALMQNTMQASLDTCIVGATGLSVNFRRMYSGCSYVAVYWSSIGIRVRFAPVGLKSFWYLRTWSCLQLKSPVAHIACCFQKVPQLWIVLSWTTALSYRCQSRLLERCLQCSQGNLTKTHS